MQNVIGFRKKASGSAESRQQRLPVNADSAIAELASSIMDFQSMAKGDIGNAVQMLGLAAQHARQIAMQLRDPAARQDFDEHIARIERLLDVAREMALDL